MKDTVELSPVNNDNDTEYELLELRYTVEVSLYTEVHSAVKIVSSEGVMIVTKYLTDDYSEGSHNISIVLPTKEIYLQKIMENVSVGIDIEADYTENYEVVVEPFDSYDFAFYLDYSDFERPPVVYEGDPVYNPFDYDGDHLYDAMNVTFMLNSTVNQTIQFDMKATDKDGRPLFSFTYYGSVSIPIEPDLNEFNRTMLLYEFGEFNITSWNMTYEFRVGSGDGYYRILIDDVVDVDPETLEDYGISIESNPDLSYLDADENGVSEWVNVTAEIKFDHKTEVNSYSYQILNLHNQSIFSARPSSSRIEGSLYDPGVHTANFLVPADVFLNANMTSGFRYSYVVNGRFLYPDSENSFPFRQTEIYSSLKVDLDSLENSLAMVEQNVEISKMYEPIRYSVYNLTLTYSMLQSSDLKLSVETYRDGEPLFGIYATQSLSATAGDHSISAYVHVEELAKDELQADLTFVVDFSTELDMVGYDYVKIGLLQTKIDFFFDYTDFTRGSGPDNSMEETSEKPESSNLTTTTELIKDTDLPTPSSSDAFFDLNYAILPLFAAVIILVSVKNRPKWDQKGSSNRSK